MASTQKNLSQLEGSKIPSASTMKFGIVVSEWNNKITSSLLEAAISELVKNGADKKNIIVKWVPGTFELTLGAQWMAENTKSDAFICLGCVIQGETRHFDFICNAVADGITSLNIKFSKPFIFGVLTTQDNKQAEERSGGKHGNKGVEAAVTAIKMLGFKQDFSSQGGKIGY